MLNLFAKLWEGVKSLFALVFPMFAGGRSATENVANQVGRWVARTILASSILFLLWLVNQAEWFGLKNLIPYGRLGDYWLPLFALCLYAMMWLGWWLYRVLSLEIEPLSSEFPDIDRAWSQAMEAQAKVDIQLDSTPLFLVLGWNSGSDEALFQASGLRMQVKQVPKDPGEPLHVTANRDGIWVTCPGASVLGQHNPTVAGEAPDVTLSSLAADGGDPYRTMGVGGGATIRLEDIVQGDLKKILAQHQRGTPGKVANPELYKARLRHLCRLIIRDRQGFCPVNGVLVLLPITAADPKADIQEIANSCRTDLTTVLETSRVRCPVLFMVCDLEKLEGFGELVERLPSGQVNKRMGQRFPLVPELSPGEVPASVQGAVDWIGGTLFPSMVFSLFHVETPGGEDLSDVMRANTQLFRFLIAMQERQERLTRLIKESIPSLPGEPLMFGGCYFAGTGEASTHQAFASGVLTRMIQDQDHVTWTADYLEEDASFHRLARYCRAFLTVFIALGSLLTVALILLLVFSRGGVTDTNPS